MPNSPYAIFFDDGGVINDNEARGPQWRKLIAEYFIPKYGKSHEEWTEANTYFLEQEIKLWDTILEERKLHDMSDFLERYDIQWVSEMFGYLDIPIPSNLECKRITRDAYDWIIPQVKSAYEGMNELVKGLSAHFDLYTSSGSEYRMLKGYYKSQGIDHCFKKLYGSDLIGVFKSHPDYFSRIFKDSGVDPKYAIFIDDKEKVLDLLDDFGTNCILSNISGTSTITGKYPVFNNPYELLEIIAEITEIKL